MRKYYPAIIIDDPLYDPLTTEENGYVNVSLHWPYNTTLPVISFWPVASLKSKTIWFVATAHDLTVKILGSLDEKDYTFPVTAEAAFTVAVGTVVVKKIGNDYTALKIQVKPAADDEHGTLTVMAHGTSAPATDDIEISADVDTQALEALVGALANPAAGSVNKQLADILAKIIAAPATETTVSGMAADIALMKADLAAIRVILES